MMKKKKKIIISAAIICFLAVTSVLCFSGKKDLEEDAIADIETIPYHSLQPGARNADYKQQYLSDLVPISKRVGYDQLRNDTDMSGNPIVMLIEGSYFSFEKGLFAHATSTLVYDLTEYSEYNYFTSFVGINNTSGSGNGVIFHFYTSNDNKTWTEAISAVTKEPKEAATFVQIPLNGAKYLKLVADSNGGNGSDHSAYADAKLVNEVEGNFILDTVDDIDKEIKQLYTGGSTIEGDLEHLVLKRELVNRIGRYTINSFYNASEENQATINWLLNDKKILNYYVMGGNPTNYYNSLVQLSRLYNSYKTDFDIEQTSESGVVLGDLYTRMAIALSLTHSQLVGLWMQSSVPENQSDAVRRYQIYKDLYLNNKFYVNSSINFTPWFENYNVEEMRYVMNANIDDEEILWLNEYVQYKIDTEPNKAWLTPHPHIAYVWPNYSNPVYYAEENYDYFNNLFAVGDKKLYDYGITRGTADRKIYKQWMNFRNKFGTGSVCGGISKSGAVIRETHGVPATVIGQPGHAALLFYSEDAQGRGYWGIDNDVSGWTLSEKGERLPLGWGNGSYAKGSYQVIYVTLAQEALNNYEALEKAEKLLMLSKSYSSDAAKQEEILRSALAIQSINLDVWLELIDVYNRSNRSEDQYYALAEQIANNLKYFPLPMYNLTNLIKPKMTSVENNFKFTLLQTKILNEGKNTPNNTADSYTVMQPILTRIEANYLLGKMDSNLSTFSFDGPDAGKIVLSSRFDGNGVSWDYSLDGKNNWNPVSFTNEEEHKYKLSSEELASITDENDIYIHIIGTTYDEENIYKIDITKGMLSSILFASDLENRVLGVNLNYEWRYNESDSWTSYSISSPDLTGDKTVQVRVGATGTSLPSDIATYTFTLDNQPDTRKYIPVSHLSVVGVSTEATSHGGAAVNAIDANFNTRWHSAWNGSDTQRYITIKLDKPVALSAVEFVPAGGGNGKIYDGTIWGSMDGENWEILVSQKNLSYTNQANTNADALINTKSFDLPSSKEVQYVKIVADRSNANWFTARAFNFYQDLTNAPHPTAGVAYSTTEPTNGAVVARLVNSSRAITITNNGGSDTYVFKENGEFTFEFVDEYGYKGSAKAKVNWIDKDLPDANIDYNITDTHKISISLDDITEDVYLLDENDKAINFITVKDKKVVSIDYLDENEEVFKTVYVDENGCITKIVYINNTEEVPSVKTYITEITDGVVSSEEYLDEIGNPIEVTEADKEALKGLQKALTDPLEYTFEESGSHEFKLLDKAENIAYKSVKVDYDDNKDIIITSDISYNITHLTNQNVIASINAFVFDSDGVKIDAQMVESDVTHTFEKNGSFEFKYKNTTDSDEEAISHSAIVTWIDKEVPTAEIKYTTLPSGEVLATLENESETIIINNNGHKREYTFKQNGEFTFEIEDQAGNIGRVTAKVDSIVIPDPVEPEPVGPTIRFELKKPLVVVVDDEDTNNSNESNVYNPTPGGNNNNNNTSSSTDIGNGGSGSKNPIKDDDPKDPVQDPDQDKDMDNDKDPIEDPDKDDDKDKDPVKDPDKDKDKDDKNPIKDNDNQNTTTPESPLTEEKGNIKKYIIPAAIVCIGVVVIGFSIKSKRH